MKEINNLEDLKSLFDKPIFEWMLNNGREVFVISSNEIGATAFITRNREIGWDPLEYFKPLPKPIEVTPEDCRRWASSEAAIGWQVDVTESIEPNWLVPFWLTFNDGLEIYQVRIPLPSEQASNETIRPLTEVVREWMVSNGEVWIDMDSRKMKNNTTIKGMEG